MGLISRVMRLDTRVPSVPQNVRRVRAAVLGILADAPVTNDRRDGFVLAVCEAINNAIEHGSPSRFDTVRILVECNDDGVHASVQSAGQWLDHESCVERGRGLILMRALADEMNLTVDRHGTTVQLGLRFRGIANGWAR